jgi:SAM-dependent methyltransferase
VEIQQKLLEKFLEMNDSKFQTWEEAVAWLISQPDRQNLVQACYYDSPLKSTADRYWQSEEWRAIVPYLPDTLGFALDIGAGRGISSYALAQDGWQVTALEPDPSDLVGVGAIRELAVAEKLAITVVQEFGENLPFADASFDLVFARQVLHHASDLDQLCREISRVLKPSGVFIAVRDHVIAKKSDLPKFLDTHLLHNIYGGENAFLLREYLDAIRSAKLEIKKIFGSFDTPINYAPHSEDSLKQELATRFSAIPCGSIVANILLNQAIFPSTLKFLSKIDRRPGKLVSFVCYKS